MVTPLRSYFIIDGPRPPSLKNMFALMGVLKRSLSHAYSLFSHSRAVRERASEQYGAAIYVRESPDRCAQWRAGRSPPSSPLPSSTLSSLGIMEQM